MNTKVSDVMTEKVIVTQPHQTVSHARGVLQRNQIHAIPVVNDEGEAVGIVSGADLLDPKNGTPVSAVMTKKVYTVSRYDGVHVAARIMRNHHIRHLVVTDDSKVVGMLSAFDLLRLVEEHRFVMKDAPRTGERRNRRRH